VLKQQHNNIRCVGRRRWSKHKMYTFMKSRICVLFIPTLRADLFGVVDVWLRRVGGLCGTGNIIRESLNPRYVEAFVNYGSQNESTTFTGFRFRTVTKTSIIAWSRTECARVWYSSRATGMHSEGFVNLILFPSQATFTCIKQSGMYGRNEFVGTMTSEIPT